MIAPLSEAVAFLIGLVKHNGHTYEATVATTNEDVIQLVLDTHLNRATYNPVYIPNILCHQWTLSILHESLCPTTFLHTLYTGEQNGAQEPVPHELQAAVSADLCLEPSQVASFVTTIFFSIAGSMEQQDVVSRMWLWRSCKHGLLPSTRLTTYLHCFCILGFSHAQPWPEPNERFCQSVGCCENIDGGRLAGKRWMHGNRTTVPYPPPMSIPPLFPFTPMGTGGASLACSREKRISVILHRTT